jgi:pectate lyase
MIVGAVSKAGISSMTTKSGTLICGNLLGLRRPSLQSRLLSAAVAVALMAGPGSTSSPAESGAVAPALPAKLPDGRQRAFPTAEGFGAAALGGRGGIVIEVTNTNEAGEGSLRACIEAVGPRTCIFRTGGTITLNEKALVVHNPYLTIAGESAPGGGIAIRNSEQQGRPSLQIFTNDVIVRHLRIRPGPHAVASCCSGALGLYSLGATNIMLDHISASWGSDETVDSEDATNFTWQWGIASEPLLDGGPGKKNRARNMLFTKGGNVTVHHSLFSTGLFRNPQIKMALPDSIADVVNNVLYSPQWQFVISFGDEWTRIRANVIGNYKIAGENLHNDRLVQLFEESGSGFSIFLQDNLDETYLPTLQKAAQEALAPEHQKYFSSERFSVPAVRTTSPQAAYEEVLANAGATKPSRDAVDQRIIEEVKNRNGHILKNDPKKVGGWPELAAGEPYPDSDHDGMADDWEAKNELNAADPTDGARDADGDGWTNLEEFLHFMAGDPTGN